MKNNTIKQLNISLRNLTINDVFSEMIPIYLASLPNSVRFEDTIWNVITWITRKGSGREFNLNFNYRNKELINVSKCWILSLRAKNIIVGKTAKSYISVIPFIDRVLGARKLSTLSNADFIEVEKLISTNLNYSTPKRTCGYLEQFGVWLNANFGLRISYKTTLTSVYLHGRKASEKDRQKKLIPTSVLIDLLAARTRDNLIDKDKFFLNAITFLIVTGFRGNELMTAPKNCMPDTGAEPCILHYPEKKAQLGSTPISHSMQESVSAAYQYLLKKTEPGREAAKLMRKKLASGEKPLDWSRIAEDEIAFRYFIMKLCHKWTAEPLHHMWNNKMAWFERIKTYIDVIKLLEEYKTFVDLAKFLKVNRSTASDLLKQQKAALRKELPPHRKSNGKKIRSSWDTDSRVLSFNQLYADTNLLFNQEYRNNVKDIIEDARDNYQLKGNIYPMPIRRQLTCPV